MSKLKAVSVNLNGTILNRTRAPFKLAALCKANNFLKRRAGPTFARTEPNT